MKTRKTEPTSVLLPFPYLASLSCVAPRLLSCILTHERHPYLQEGMLVSTDGPDRNVIKCKPPLCVTETDVDELTHAIGRALDDYDNRR